MPTLNFKGKSIIETYHHALPHHTFEFDAKASVLAEGQTPSLDGNLIIEGDNLKGLKALLPTHAGKIKCVYIDPPYNTGNEGWIYNDNLTAPQFKEWIGKEVGNEGEDSTRHDKWCCMMYPRLQLLKELLREDGVIFISIDDNEVHHLRMLMDEIFGAENLVAQIIWEKRSGPPNDRVIGSVHEYILVYVRDIEDAEIFLLARTQADNARYSNPDNDPRGDWVAGDLSANAKGGRFVASLYYEVTNPRTGKKHLPPAGACWRFNKEKMQQLIDDGRVLFGSNDEGRPKFKRYLTDVREGITVPTIWKNLATNVHSRNEIQRIFGTVNKFETPKPVALIKRIISIGAGIDSTVLDLTAGSGTTAHATLEANKEDGGNRRFILIQQAHDTRDDEKKHINICHDITRERVKRVIEGTNIEATGGTFSYLKLSENPLMGEFRNFDPPPSYYDLAQYIFFTDTSTQLDPQVLAEPDLEQTGFIGQHAGQAYYLLYRPDEDVDWGIDLKWLDEVAALSPCLKLVVYCERRGLHDAELREWANRHGRSVRVMIVPAQLS